MPTALSKDFHITLSDLDFIHQQVTAPRIMIIGYDIQGNPIYGLIPSDQRHLAHRVSWLCWNVRSAGDNQSPNGGTPCSQARAWLTGCARPPATTTT